MPTSLGAPDPGEFERNQPHNLFNDRRIGGKSKNRAVGESVPKRKVNFYDSKENFSHSADVRWLSPKGYRSGRPHGSELKKHMKPMGGWALPEYDNNPNAPKDK